MAKYINKSEQGFMLTSLNKVIRPDSRFVHDFSDEDISKDGLLAHLIKNGYLVPFTGEQEISLEKDKNIERPQEKTNLAVPIGEAYTQIHILGNTESTVSYNPNEILSIGATKNHEILNIRKTVDENRAGMKKVASTEVVDLNQSISSNAFSNNGAGVVQFESSTSDYTPRKKRSSTNEVWICSPANDASGYGKFGRQIIYGLQKRDTDVQLDLFKIPDFRAAVPLTPGLKTALETNVDPKSPSIWAIMPPKYLNRPGHKILYTMMETQGIPESFMQKCNNADELWLPSCHNMEMFKEDGCKVPMYHIPLGVDEKVYKPMQLTEEQKGILNIKTRGFVFLSLFGWSLRKGYDALLRSYLETFSDKDDVTLLIVARKDGMSTDEKNQEIIDKIKEFVKAYKPNGYPHIVHIGKPLQEETLPIIYNMSDCFVLPSRGEAWCTLPDAQIKTPKGVKEIQDIEIGDVVFTHRGVEGTVSKTFKREYNGEMLKIKCFGRNNQSLTLTPNHMVRAVRTSQCSSQTIAKMLKNCSYDFEKDAIVYQDNTFHHNKKYNKLQLEWIRSDELKKGDVVFYPSIKYNEKIEEIDLSLIDSIRERNAILNDKVYKTGRNQTGKFYITSQCLLEKTKIKINKNLMKLFGYYVAEGCCNRKGDIKLAFHEEETDYINEVREIMFDEFGLNSNKTSVQENKHCLIVNFHCSVIADMFLFLFGHKARNKKIPNWFFNLEKDLIMEFLKGLFRGDGSFGKQRSSGGQSCDKVSYSTGSVNMANGVFDLLSQMGFSSTIKSRILTNSKTHGFGKKYYSVNITNVKDHNVVMGDFDEEEKRLNSNRHYRHSKCERDFQLLKIREIEKINYEGYVYNFGVDGDNSYICENVAVHNCMPATEAGSCEKPVIATRCGGQLDFLNDENSYLVDIEGYSMANQELKCVSSYYGDKPFAVLGEKTNKQLREVMRAVYEDDRESRLKAKKLRENLVNNFTWDHCCDRVYDRLKAIW